MQDYSTETNLLHSECIHLAGTTTTEFTRPTTNSASKENMISIVILILEQASDFTSV